MQKTMKTKQEFTDDLFRKNPQYPSEFIHLVAMVAALYKELKKEMDEEKALALVKSVFLPIGLAMQMGNFRYVEENHTFKNLIHYQQRTNKEGPTQLNRMEVIKQNDKIYEFHVHNCMFKDEFAKLNMPELTGVMCAIDNAIFNTYLPDEVHFHRNGPSNTLIEGEKYCTFICENKER